MRLPRTKIGGVGLPCPPPLSALSRWSWLDEEPKIRVHVQTPPNWPDVGVF